MDITVDVNEQETLILPYRSAGDILVTVGGELNQVDSISCLQPNFFFETNVSNQMLERILTIEPVDPLDFCFPKPLAAGPAGLLLPAALPLLLGVAIAARRQWRSEGPPAAGSSTRMERILKSARESGSLNLSNRSLSEVPGEVYNNLDTGSLDDKWWEGVDLQKLILAHNNLEVLREDLRNLSSLVVLNISHNQISSLPAAIGEVDFSNNCLTELPASLGRCLNLSELKASNNNISRLPDELAGCCKLSKFDLEGNKLVLLPENMFTSWTLLTELNAAKNQLTAIPASIGALSKLVRMDLHQNKITSIPSSINGCSSLAEFYMGNNLLSTIPDDIGMLSKLGTLDLHSNQLKEYPVGACKLKLSFLDLSNNALSGLPPELGTMTTLRKLLLSGNPMRALRSSLVSGPTSTLMKYLRSRLSSEEEASGSRTTPTKDDQISAARRLSVSSKELNLSGLGVPNVPPAAWETSDVVKLDLSKNLIEDLPNELSLCSSLQALILSNNKIKKWPGMVVSSLPSLTILKLDNNPLAEISSTDLVSLSKLEVLDLSGNASSFSESSVVSSLPQLHELYLRFENMQSIYATRMKLQEFPIGLVQLKHLRILNLSQNNLSTIPEGIKDFSALIELDLSDNNITRLPAELGLLEPSLQVLKLDGNPLRRNINEAKWSKPDPRFIKLNVDAAFYPDEGVGATAAIIRDDRADIITTEALAMRDGLVFANVLGCSRVEAESDSL
ncbi:Leucine-rich repeat-containing protein 40 [Triticum urartu]|uniref:Leucine-rich repeat-containing protein 40 n=1 Tax=Triticum urartu TaxID=4572 RepID=M8A125_TRIUA|nr:Leucine-rich repeat-containing protein 40 [Triticum urartu]